MGQNVETIKDTPRAARAGETWNDHWKRELEQGRYRGAASGGDRTRPPQPDGTTPLARDLRPINQSR